MTLILARASSEFVLQVTDRLVTNSCTKQPFDRVANKNILCFTSNAVVALAYTGNAYLDGVPTDHWIVEKLTGIKIDPNNPPMQQGGQNKTQQDVGQALCRLRYELDRQAQSQRLDLTILMQGWQWDSKGRFRPLVGSISNSSTDDTFVIYYEARDWYLKGAHTISAPAVNMSDEELTKLSYRLRNKSAYEAEALLVETIREVSQGNSWVGPHCMSILLPPPSDPNISVRYHAADPSTLLESQRLVGDQQVWAYSPWILGPRMCMPPGEITGGGFTITYGPFTIRFISETPKHPEWLLAHSGQKRRMLP